MRRFVLVTLLLLACVSSSSGAQSGTTPAPPNDSLFRRARRMVGEGNGAAGRAIVDSLLKKAEEGTTTYGDALFWRGALAETAAAAERDYRQVIVEYPLSHYADDALLAIVELEQARGDRAGALAHLQRFVREHPVSAARGVAALAAARLAFDQRDTKTGCAMITEARTSASSTDVELRNQIDYFGSRCTAVAMAETPIVPPASTPATPPRDTTAVPKKVAGVPPKLATEKGQQVPTRTTSVRDDKGVTPATRDAKVVAPPVREDKGVAPATRDAKVVAPPAREDKAVKAPPARVNGGKGIYTIQLAAYNTRPDAEQLVKKLEAKGVAARVSGTTRPFRVRLNFFPTRQAAQDEIAALKARGIIGFVTTEERAPAGKSP